VFYDSKGGVYQGREEIGRIAGALRITHPDLRYQLIAEPEEVSCVGRLTAKSSNIFSIHLYKARFGKPKQSEALSR
jgi:hypothetical protein